METKQGIITGIIKKSGYGYIQPDESQEKVFFHASGVCSPNFSDLREGMPVNYFLVDYVSKGEKREKAIGVVSI